MSKFKLSEEKILANYNQLLSTLDLMFPTRAESLKSMYAAYADVMVLAPASSYEHFHNAMPGGYIDHVLRVLEFSFKVYENWKLLGLRVDDFTVEEMAFVALHHDLGKLGFPGKGNERYLVNESAWHRENLGKLYEPNSKIPFSLVQHMSLYILQAFGITCSWNEFLGILIHDGLYDEVNIPYLKSNIPSAGLKSNLPLIIGQADHMASIFERERWENS